MLGKIDLSTMKCPKCGNVPELRIRSRGMCMGNGEIRCPYGCHRYGTSFHSGHEELARKQLVDKWRALLEKDGQNDEIH